MKRQFELVTPLEWDDAVLRQSSHADVIQAFSHMKEQREAVKIPVPKNLTVEKKRHVILEYARRRGLVIETLAPHDGWIYIRLRPENAQKRRGPARKKDA
jgi:hypothetical protein